MVSLAPPARAGVSGSRYVPVGGKIGDECLNFGNPHLSGMALLMMENETFAPIDIGLFRAKRVMFGS